MAMSSAGGMGRAWQRLRGLPGRTPLRVKLITAVLALVAVALAVISFTGISVLRGYLLNQYDNTLQSYVGQAENDVARYLTTGGTFTSPQGYVIWVPSGGKPHQVVQQTAGFSPYAGVSGQPQTLPGPQVPANSAWLAANLGHYVTVPAQTGGGSWRVLVEAASYGPPGSTINGSVIVGVDATSVYNTIGQLAGLDLIVSAVLLLGILIVGIAVVRASLRPLNDIERTAEAIAAGDLTRRVPDRDPRTEVGRLGRSLNSMLAQIETAFDARAASELAARRSEERMRQFVADASHELRTPLTAIRGFAEYYRQRGGVEEVSGAPSRTALGNGADTAAHHADTAAQDADSAGHQAGTGAHEAATAPPDGPASPRDADMSPGPAPEGAGQADGGQLARADLDRIMQRVEQESSRMGVLVEDMLLLARLDQQRPLEQRTVDMLTLAADAVHDARLVAPDRNIGLTVGAGAALLVVGDEVRLRQVIGNLMSNALNHTPDGTPIEVRVGSGSLDEWRQAAAGAGRTALAVSSRDIQPMPAVILEVADQGPGLTPYQAEHVFERFYRADQARTRKAGGTGLGLAIVAALVAAHGGTVWVESPPGGGATFRIAIPLAPEARHIEPDPDDGADGPDILDSRGTLGPRPGPHVSGPAGWPTAPSPAEPPWPSPSPGGQPRPSPSPGAQPRPSPSPGASPRRPIFMISD
jgi:two-component system OmpR family sensor kinase